ncbi:MAG: hypothetical protein WC227_03035 [Patescibacteria group bacterium]
MNTAITAGPAAGVNSITYHDYQQHALPSDHGLIIQKSGGSELILIRNDGHQVSLGDGHYGWYPTKAGVAIQKGTRYYLAPYDGSAHDLLYRSKIPDHLRCCDTGMILAHKESEFLYVPFDRSEPKVFWDGRGVNITVHDGIVIGSHKNRNWVHAKVNGVYNIIFTDRDWGQKSSMGQGYVWDFHDGLNHCYPYNGGPPAATKYANCGSCCKGIVANFRDKVIVYPFGGGEILLWTGPYTRWYGSCDAGLFIIVDDKALLLPYDGTGARELWIGPYKTMIPFSEALLVLKELNEIVMIPIPKPVI